MRLLERPYEYPSWKRRIVIPVAEFVVQEGGAFVIFWALKPQYRGSWWRYSAGMFGAGCAAFAYHLAMQHAFEKMGFRDSAGNVT
jgi:hypothetical protein